MARGRRKPIEEFKEKIIATESITQEHSKNVKVQIKKALLHTYRISGKVGDVINVPAKLVDELIQKKLVVKI